MTSLADIIAAAEPFDGGFHATIPADWMQGRTSYGGLSAALALHGAHGLAPDLPPLRSALISFIGPLAGEVRVSATMLRRGRNAAFVQSDILSDAGLGFRATFVFMAALASKVDHDRAPRAPHPVPMPDTPLYRGPPGHFTGNFEFLDLREAAGPTEWLRWGRLRHGGGLDPMVELIAMADALPPAVFKLFDRTAPLSSLTWMVNLLTPEPRTRDGWWLLRAGADIARGGNSSQRMTIWNAAGEPVAEGMQSVAIFA